MKRDFLSISDVSATEFEDILELSWNLKQEYKTSGKNDPVFSGKTLIMIFEKPSLRTHASFDIGMAQLGGHALYFGPEHIGLGKREPVAHAAEVLSRMGDIIMARVFDHRTVVELAKYSRVPVINGLSDLEHPCQILADMLTIKEYKKKLKGIKLAYIGDGENNVTHSLALAAGLMGLHMVSASPEGYWMHPSIVSKARGYARASGGSIEQVFLPEQAVEGADAVYTDTWVSMGDETEKDKRMKLFRPFQVDSALMKRARPDAVFMHDMPAYLGNEVTAEVFDSEQSVAYTQAENRLHAQKGLLVWLASQGLATLNRTV